MKRAERPHLEQFDILRGAAIVAVVYLHSYFTPWPEASPNGLAALRAAHLVAHGAVPLFLFVAAFLQATGPRESAVEHLRRRAWSIWAPVFLWMAATLVYRLATEGSHRELWRDLALFDVSGQFYFVWLLLVFGVVLTQAWRAPSAWLTRLVALAFVANLATIAFYAAQPGISGLFATLAYRNPLAWAFFPALGYAMGRRGITAPRARTLASLILAMAVAASVYFYRGVRFDAWPVSYFGVSVFLFSAAAMPVYVVLGERLASVRPVAEPLAWLSRYAFPIFLVHLPFAIGFGTDEILGDGAAWPNYWLLLHANAAIGLFVSLAFVREVEKASPWLAARALGVRRSPLARPRGEAVPAMGSTGP